ncbi:hypothetical protein HQ560_00720 [bacterium]|nr:hypothetical protein [bacterium]
MEPVGNPLHEDETALRPHVVSHRRPPSPSLGEQWLEAVRSLSRLVVRRNPAYLVSAALMIWGVYTILQPADPDLPPGHLPAILATLSTFQVYEFLLVGIAAFLVCRRRVMDDGATLVLIEALFVVGSFIIVDEITFGAGRIGLGSALALAAAVLAALRFGALGPVVGRRLPLSLVGVLLLGLFAWNALMPAALARLNNVDDPSVGAAYHLGWWLLSAVALAAAGLAETERRGPPSTGRPFLERPIARWVLLGAVLLGSAIHHYGIGYVLDREFLLSDAIPLATLACLSVVTLLCKGSGRVTPMAHLVAALPPALCVTALLCHQFEPVVPPVEFLGAGSEALHKLRVFTWPTAWLWVAAFLTLAQALRWRSPALVHQGAAAAVLGALLLPTILPEQIELSFFGCRIALAAYCFVGAVVYRSPWFLTGFLLIVNYEVGAAAYETPVARRLFDPQIVVLTAAGASCYALCWVFRSRVPAFVAHIGSVVMVIAAGMLHSSPTTQLSTSVLGGWSVALAGLMAATALAYRWWPYYGLAALSLSFSPGRIVQRSEATIGSWRGWMLVFGAFLTLGIGFLISTRKAPSVTGSSAAP